MHRTVLVLGSTTLIGAIVSAHLWQQLAESSQVVQALQRQLSERPAGQSYRQALALAAGEARPAPSLQATAGDAVQAPAIAPQNDAAPRSEQRVASSSFEMLKSPALREAMAASVRASLPQRYPFLGEELGLTAEQLGKLYDQLTQNQLELLAEMPASTPDVEARNQAASRREELAQAHEAGLASLLGATGYHLWQEYQQTLDTRQQVGRLDTVLQSSARPLSDAQRRQLTVALVAHDRQLKLASPQTAEPPAALTHAEKTALVTERLQAAQANSQRLLETAAAYLGPEQLEAFSRMQNQESTLALAMLGTRQP